MEEEVEEEEEMQEDVGGLWVCKYCPEFENKGPPPGSYGCEGCELCGWGLTGSEEEDEEYS